MHRRMMPPLLVHCHSQNRLDQMDRIKSPANQEILTLLIGNGVEALQAKSLGNQGLVLTEISHLLHMAPSRFRHDPKTPIIR